MKSIFLAFSVMLMASASLQAQAFYVEVMSVKHKAVLDDIAKKLDNLGYGMYLSRHGKRIRVYAGPFDNRRDADEALLVIRAKGAKSASVIGIPAAKTASRETVPPVSIAIPKPGSDENRAVLRPVPDADETKPAETLAQNRRNEQAAAVLQPENKEEADIRKSDQTLDIAREDNEEAADTPKSAQAPAALEQDSGYQEHAEVPRSDRYFAGATLGGSKLYKDEKTISGNLSLPSGPDDTGVAYGVEWGYYFNDRLFTTLNYKRTTLDDMYFDNLFATLNYRFDEWGSLFPYVGVLGGYTAMRWKRSPIDASDSDAKSTSFMGGMQAGVEMPVEGHVSLYLLYQSWMMEHITRLKSVSGEEELEYFFEQNFNIGIKYGF